jgi:dipeptidyl aminopeptidase/acylaminoacyl peptidase
VARLDPDSATYSLSPIDPATGNTVEGYPPISLGVNFYYSITRDRRTLIFASYPSANPSRAAVDFVDLTKWQDDPAIQLPSKGWASALTVSADGSRFAMATVQPKDTSLWLMDVTRHVVLAHALTPLLINNMQFTPDSQGLLIYGQNEDHDNGLSHGPPVAELRSAQDLQIEWSKVLSSVREGFVPNQSYKGNAHDPRVGTTFRPAVVFAPDADVMYIVHADVDRLTRVDFARKTVLTQDIRQATSLLERIVEVTAGNAYAKGQEGAERSAVISADGSTIFTCGTQNKFVEQPNGTLVLVQTRLPLRALDAAHATQIFQSEAMGSDLDLSGDGSAVLVPQMNYDTGYVTSTTEVNSATGKINGEDQGFALRTTHRMDGTPLAVSSTSLSASQVSSYALSAFGADGAPLGHWEEPVYTDWLIVP